MEQADRFNEEKLQWSLVDFKSLEPLVQVLTYGTKKYSRNNWKKGLPPNKTCESLLRHIFAYMSGEDVDPESNLSHIGHMMCNVMFLSYNATNHPELEDREINNITKKENNG